MHVSWGFPYKCDFSYPQNCRPLRWGLHYHQGLESHHRLGFGFGALGFFDIADTDYQAILPWLALPQRFEGANTPHTSIQSLHGILRVPIVTLSFTKVYS